MDVGVFRESGIKTPDNKWFAGKSGCCHKPETYGYRRGTEEEAMRLKLTQQKAPAGGVVNSVSPAVSRQVSALSNDTKRVNDRVELQSKFQHYNEDRTAKVERQLVEERKLREEERIEREKKEAEAKKREEAQTRQIIEMQRQLQLLIEQSRGSDPSNLPSTRSKPAQAVLPSSNATGNGSMSANGALPTSEKSTTSQKTSVGRGRPLSGVVGAAKIV